MEHPHRYTQPMMRLVSSRLLPRHPAAWMTIWRVTPRIGYADKYTINDKSTHMLV